MNKRRRYKAKARRRYNRALMLHGNAYRQLAIDVIGVLENKSVIWHA